MFKLFKKFKGMAQKESGCIINKFRIDRGGEYTSIEFEELYEIKYEIRALYTSQHNDTIE